MRNSRGFGLVGILIILVMVAGIAGTSFYALQNVWQVDTLDNENGKKSINSAIQRAEDVKLKVEDLSDKTEDIQNVDNELLDFDEAKDIQNVGNEQLLQDCLQRAQRSEESVRKQMCEDLGIPVDEFGNCVGIDFVETETTSTENCYSKYPLD